MSLTFLLSLLFHLFHGAALPVAPDTSGAVTGARARMMDSSGVLTGLKVRPRVPKVHPATVKVMDSSGVLTG